MTSSLVGSEMCIRDRPCRHNEHQPQGFDEDRQAEESSARLLGSHSKKAVSYTHLTLPTICSV
eukprot:7143639-Prorocentrum_lima.AAC.1